MNILYCHQHFSTPDGASGSRSYEMARRLIARGHGVTMVCGSYKGGQTGLSTPFIKGKRRGLVDGIDVIEFDLSYANKDGFIKRAVTFIKFSWRSTRLVFTENYDVLFATTTPLTAGIPGILARWLRRKPFVFEVRDLWPELPRAMGVIKNPFVLMGLACLERLSYRSATRLIGLSPGIVEGICQQRVDPDRVTMISNGCDLALFGDVCECWRPEGVGADDLMAVYTGTHGIANGLDALIDAAIVLKKRERHDIKLVLVGDGKLKEALKVRVEKEGLTNVLFHEPVSKRRLVGLLASANLGLQLLENVPAFYYGTSPNKFFDYLAAGLPVLVNYPGWVADLITTNHCGVVVPPENPTAFADALEMAASNSLLLKTFAINARRLAEQAFNRAVLADQFVDWIDGCAKNS